MYWTERVERGVASFAEHKQYVQGYSFVPPKWPKFWTPPQRLTLVEVQAREQASEKKARATWDALHDKRDAAPTQKEKDKITKQIEEQERLDDVRYSRERTFRHREINENGAIWLLRQFSLKVRADKKRKVSAIEAFENLPRVKAIRESKAELEEGRLRADQEVQKNAQTISGITC